MEVLTVLRVLLGVVPLLVSVERSECVRCFAHFNVGQCDEELGEVDQDVCCQNPHYGYQATDGVCRSCGPPMWSLWSSWSQCNILCGAGVRQRSRKCFGFGECEDATNKLETVPCNGTYCDGTAPLLSTPGAVDGAWGSWSSLSSCSVTCGVGLQVSIRSCDSPTPKNGGQPCPGEKLQTNICRTNVHCPVDGSWSEWTPWSQCQHRFSRSRDIRCKQLSGTQSRDHRCLHQAFNGSMCTGSLSERRICYDVNRCYMRGTWNGWEPWSLCKPACGENSRRFRKRRCDPDYSEYSPTIGRMKEPATFFGTPMADCGPTPDGGRKIEIENCQNVPPCP